MPQECMCIPRNNNTRTYISRCTDGEGGDTEVVPRLPLAHRGREAAGCRGGRNLPGSIQHHTARFVRTCTGIQEQVGSVRSHSETTCNPIIQVYCTHPHRGELPQPGGEGRGGEARGEDYQDIRLTVRGAQVLPFEGLEDAIHMFLSAAK